MNTQWLWRALLTAALTLPCASWAQVSIHRMSATQFSAAIGERVVYSVRTMSAGTLTLEMVTADGDVVRRLVVPNVVAGEHELVWDGKDDRGFAVPDEAYCARANLVTALARVDDDSCRHSGGEVMTDIDAEMAPGGDIAYSLTRPSRVLIRVGVKGGAMMRSLAVWRPRPAGRNVQRWTGFDESGLIDLRSDRLALLVSAFALPEFAVTTSGQDSLDYRAWRLANGWAEQPDKRVLPSAATPMERNGARISKHFYAARYRDREPRISVNLVGANGQALPSDAPLPLVARVVVDMHPDDHWLMQEQLYEVGFFLDGDFVAEEENGYMPIGWLWNTAALKPGRHMLTVNLTGFGGRVGTKTIELRK